LNPAENNAMTMLIEQVARCEEIWTCQDQMLKVFHKELGFRALSFPDNYEDS